MNRELADLIRRLPDLAERPVSGAMRDQAYALADEVRRTDWELPLNFESLQFHVLGLRRRKWLPAYSKRLAVTSPFCSAGVLQQLAGTTDEPVLLISRIEELAKLPREAVAAFGRVMRLSEAAETEDGEDASATPSSLRGLHAKVYIAEDGRHTRIAIGSANATRSALDGSNVELLAELTGKRSRIGGIDSILEQGGFADLLEDYRVGDAPTNNAELEQACALLDRAADDLPGSRWLVKDGVMSGA